MDTIARLKELAQDRGISLFHLSKLCNVSYSTFKNAETRNGQLSLDSIERICLFFDIPLYEFFMTDEDWAGIEAYAIRRMHEITDRSAV